MDTTEVIEQILDRIKRGRMVEQICPMCNSAMEVEHIDEDTDLEMDNRLMFRCNNCQHIQEIYTAEYLI